MTIENRTLSDFSQIVLEGNGELILVHGDSPAVVIETDPETLEHIKTEVVDGKLILGMKSWLDAILHGWKRVTYTVTYRQLESVSISGSGKAHAAQLESNQFRFTVSGSGSLIVETLTAIDLEIHISGSAHLDLTGSVNRQVVHINGSAKMEAWALDSKTAEVRISGSGELMLKVSDALDVAISGSGSVRYLGSPKVTQSISGSGSIKPMG